MKTNDALLHRADRWIEENRDALVRDICRLVRIRSVCEPGSQVAPYGQACRDVLGEMFAIGRELGFHCQSYEDRCGALWLCEREETIGIWGHLDVVPEGDHWTYPPFEATEEKGYLYGRGVSDNKGPAVAALYALKALEQAGFAPLRGHRVYVGLCEELGMDDVAYFREHYPCPELSIVPDAEFPVCFAEKGLMQVNLRSTPIPGGVIREIRGGIASNVVPDWAQARLLHQDGLEERLTPLPEGLSLEREGQALVLTASGATRHVAFPEGGINAIHRLTSVLLDSGVLGEGEADALRLFTDVNRDFYGTGIGIHCEDSLSGRLTCVGSMIFMEEGCLRLHMNIRYPVSAKSDKIIASIKERAAGENCLVEIVEDSAPSYFEKENPIVKQLTEIFNDYTGLQTEPYAMGGGTYARMLPCAFAFGMEMPGAGSWEHLPQGHGGAHQPDECLSVSNLLDSVKIYCRTLIALDKLPLK